MRPNLIEQIVVYDHEKRITALQAMYHHFFRHLIMIYLHFNPNLVPEIAFTWV